MLLSGENVKKDDIYGTRTIHCNYKVWFVYILSSISRKDVISDVKCICYLPCTVHVAFSRFRSHSHGVSQHMGLPS